MNEERAIGIIDDEEEFLGIIKKELEERLSTRVFFSKEINDVIKWVEHRKISTLASDLRMSTLDGINLLKTVRKIDPHINLVLLTGFVLSEIELKICQDMDINILYKEEGFDNIISNIISINERSKELDFNSSAKLEIEKSQLKKITEIRKLKELKEQIIDPISIELIEELKLLKDPNKKIHVDQFDTIKVKDLIKEIEDLSPLGIKYIHFMKSKKR
jgi:DNA-binding NtrC family response regulator